MSKLFSRSLILATTTIVLGMASQVSVAEAGSRNRCNLNIKGSGLYSCQCEILVNHRAEWRVLMRLSSMNVCNSPAIGGGNSDNPPPVRQRRPKCHEEELEQIG